MSLAGRVLECRDSRNCGMARVVADGACCLAGRVALLLHVPLSCPPPYCRRLCTRARQPAATSQGWAFATFAVARAAPCV